MESEWELGDALSQLEILLAHRRALDFDMYGKEEGKCVPMLSFVDFSEKPQKALAFLQALPEGTRHRVNALDHTSTIDSMNHLQAWIVSRVSADSLGPAIAILIAYLQSYTEPLNEGQLKDLPSTKKHETVIQESQQGSVTSFLFELSLSLVASQLEKHNGNASAAFDSFFNAWSSVAVCFIQHCFERLAYFNAPSVRARASQCLSVLSQHPSGLNHAAALFLSKLAMVDTEAAEREYAVYQTSIADLGFGFGTADTSEFTIDYFEKLCSQMANIDRGVLRQEICRSIQEVMYRLLTRHDEQRIKDMNRMKENKQHSLRFWRVYGNLFESILRWSKKPKHIKFCLETLSTLQSFGSIEFQCRSGRTSTVSLLLSHIKKDDLRLHLIKCIRDYLENLDPEFVSVAEETFNAETKEIITVLFPKKKTVPPAEARILVRTLTQIGSLKFDLLASSLISDAFRAKSSLSTLQRAVVLEALGELCSNPHVDIASFESRFRNPISELLQSERDGALVVHAMKCFVRLFGLDEDAVQLATCIVRRIRSTDREVSNAAILTLRQFVAVDNSYFMINVIYLILDDLMCLDSSTQDVVKMLNTVSFLLVAYAEHLAASPAALEAIPVGQWVALQQHIEGVAIVWMNHDEPLVRVQACHALDVFKIPVLREIQVQGENPSGFEPVPFLVDFVYTSASTEGLPDDPCAYLLEEHVEPFEGVFNWAWSLVGAEVPSFMNSYKKKKAEDLSLFLRRLRFLAQAFRPSKERTGMVLQEYWDIYEARSRSHRTDRPMLTPLTLNDAASVRFVQYVMSMLHSPKLDEIRPKLVTAITALRVEALDTVLGHMRHQILHVTKDNSEKPRYNPRVDYFFHPPTLHLIGSVLQRIENVKRFAIKTGTSPLFIAEFVQKWITAKENAFDSNIKSSANLIVYFYLRLLGTGGFSHPKKSTMEQKLMDSVSRIDGVAKAEKDSSSIEFEDEDSNSEVDLSFNSDARSRSFYAEPADTINTEYLGATTLDLAREMGVYVDDLGEDHRVPLLNLITNHLSADADDQKSELDRLGVQSIRALAYLGPLDNEAVRHQCCLFLEHSLLRDMDHFDAVLEAFTVLLGQNRVLIRSFLTNSISENIASVDAFMTSSGRSSGKRASQHSKTLGHRSLTLSRLPSSSHTADSGNAASVFSMEDRNSRFWDSSAGKRTVIALAYYKALSRHLRENMGYWMSHAQIRIPHLLLWSLFFQCQPLVETREEALATLNAMMLPQYEHRLMCPDAGHAQVPQFSHVSPYLFVERAVGYSRAMAAHHWDGVLEVLEEAHRLMKMTDVSNREVILRLLLPWIEQFGRFVQSQQLDLDSAEHDSISAHVQGVLTTLFLITGYCSTSTVLSYLIRDIWVSLVSHDQFAIFTIPETIHFTLKRFASASPEERSLFKMIFVYLSRANAFAASTLVKLLVEALSRYNNVVPVKPVPFLKWATKAQKSDIRTEPLISREAAAFALLGNLVYEHPALVAPHYPLLLHMTYALVQIHDRSEAMDMVSYVGLHLRLLDAYVSDSQFTDLVPLLQEGGHIELLQQWATCAFQWYLQSHDPSVRDRSLAIYLAIGSGMETASLQHSILLVYLSVEDNDYLALSKAVELLQSPPRDHRWDRLEWAAVFATSISLLAYPHQSAMYEHGLLLLDRQLGVKHPPHVTSVVHSLQPLWSETAGELDAGIVHCLEGGSLSVETAQPTFMVSCVFAQVLSSSLGANNKCLLFTVITGLLSLSRTLDRPAYASLDSIVESQHAFAQLMAVFGAYLDPVDALKNIFLQAKDDLAVYIEDRIATQQTKSNQALYEQATSEQVTSYVDLLRSLMRSTMRELATLFPSDADFEFLFDLLCRLLSRCDGPLRNPALHLLTSLLESRPGQCSEERFAHAYSLMTDCLYCKDEETVAQAIQLGPILVQSAPSSFDGGKVNFLRPLTARRHMKASREVRSSDAYRHVRQSMEQGREGALRRIELYVFAILASLSD